MKHDELISREQAIDALDGVKVDEKNCDEYDIGYNDGINFAISKLSVLPTAQPEPCNYVNACFEVSMNNILSTYNYLHVLKEFKKYGYVLVEDRNIRANG